MTKPDSRSRLHAEVRAAADVLRLDWDPIGGGDMADLRADEYDSYAPRVVAMIERGATDADVAIYLDHLEAQIMEVPSGRDLVIIARKLRSAVAAVHSRAT